MRTRQRSIRIERPRRLLLTGRQINGVRYARRRDEPRQDPRPRRPTEPGLGDAAVGRPVRRPDRLGADHPGRTARRPRGGLQPVVRGRSLHQRCDGVPVGVRRPALGGHARTAAPPLPGRVAARRADHRRLLPVGVLADRRPLQGAVLLGHGDEQPAQRGRARLRRAPHPRLHELPVLQRHDVPRRRRRSPRQARARPPLPGPRARGDRCRRGRRARRARRLACRGVPADGRDGSGGDVAAVGADPDAGPQGRGRQGARHPRPRPTPHRPALPRGRPADCWADHFAGNGEKVAAGGLGEVVFAGPFIPTLPGTETYVDQLR